MELIKCTSEYWEFVREVRMHPENQRWFYTQMDITSLQQQEYMAINSYKYEICIYENIPVGYIGLIKNNEITYCVHPNYKKKGIGTFMVSELIKKYNDLTAFVIPENVGSNKVFEKLGFTKQIFYSYKK